MPPRLYLLPGLATDRRLFEPQLSLPLDLHVLPWLPPEPRESPLDYARRFAEQIDPTVPFLLGGISFGGMMACQLTRFLRPRALILISSCRHPAGLPAWYAPPVTWLTRHCPPHPLKRLLTFAPLLALPFGPMDRPCHCALVAMAHAAELDLFTWSLRTVTSLPPAPLEDTPVHQIHGRRDRIIPLRLQRPRPTVVVEDAGHMINLTHPRQVNAFILDAVRRTGLTAGI